MVVYPDHDHEMNIYTIIIMIIIMIIMIIMIIIIISIIILTPLGSVFDLTSTIPLVNPFNPTDNPFPPSPILLFLTPDGKLNPHDVMNVKTRDMSVLPFIKPIVPVPK